MYYFNDLKQYCHQQKWLKVNTLLVIICFGILSNIAHAQNYYQFTSTNSTYKDLQSAKIIAKGNIQAGYNYSDSLVFPMYSYNMDFNYKKSITDGAYIGKNGFIAIDESSYKYTAILDVAYGDYKMRDSNTSVSSVYEGKRGKGILKFEWKNMGIIGHPNTDFVNFQVWLDESDHSISFHYGPSFLSFDHDPVIGLMRATNNSDTFTHSTFLKGSSTQVNGLSVYSVKKIPVYPISGFPEDGTVYTFSNQSVNLAEPALLDFKVYPNPCDGYLYFSGITEKSEIKILDVLGRVVLNEVMDIQTSVVSVKELPEGIYWLIVNEYPPIQIIVN